MSATDAGLIEWGDASFEPAPSGGGGGFRKFVMSATFPSDPRSGRKFQLGGKERIAFLNETVFHTWIHRYSQKHLGSAVNGTRQCTLDKLGTCKACEHYEAAEYDEQAKKKKARCGKRQQSFGANVLVYKTNLKGEPLDEDGNVITFGPDGLPTAMPVAEVYFWQFNAEKFIAIRDIKNEWETLKNNDILCTLAANKQDTFQDFGFTTLPKCLWKLAGAKDKAWAVELVREFKEKSYDLPNTMGKDHTHEEIEQFLGLRPMDSQDASAAVAGGQPVEDVAAAIEAELGAVSGTATIGGDAPTPEPVAPSAPPAEAPAPPATAPTTNDFDDLLKTT